MVRLSERILSGIELVFLRLAIQLLSIARPITKSTLAQAQDRRGIFLPLNKRAYSSFGKNLISALSGWAIGILLGYLLTIWIF
jgi:hypothetical protein